MNDFITKNKHILLVLALAVLSVFISYFYIGYTQDLGSDATEFKQAQNFLSEGGEVSKEVLMNRVVPSPLFLYTSMFVSIFTKSFSTSSALINLLFYFGCVVAFYFLALEIYNEKKVAILSTTLV